MSVTRKELKARLMQDNGAEYLYKEFADDEWLIDDISELAADTFDACAVPACAYLARAAKKARARQQISYVISPNVRDKIMMSDNAKLRKNGAKLIGEICDYDDIPLLIHALNVEQTLFVVPSVILALGRFDDDNAKNAIAKYTSPANADADQKHIDAIHDALHTAMHTRGVQHTFIGLSAVSEFVLTACGGLEQVLAEELRAYGYAANVEDGYVTLRTDDYAGLFRARCFNEALMVISMDKANAADPVACAKLAAGFADAVNACFKPCTDKSALRYRLELPGGAVDRRSFAKTFDKELSKLDNRFENSTSDYELELRIDGSAMFVKFCCVPDTRFSYRVGELPASVNPATAVAVMRAFGDLLGQNARVADICCGSGTMLIERTMYKRCAKLYCNDIMRNAVNIARQNFAAAGLKNGVFVCRDCAQFEAGQPFDEVISNLPFGNRVGTHGSNIRLYAGILNKLPHWLKRGGTAILYTADGKLLRRLIAERPYLKLLREIKLSSGGLEPYAFGITVL